MIKNVLVVTGSVRPNSVNQSIVPLVVAELEKQGAVANVADIGAMNLPFYNAPTPPSAPDFIPPNEPAKQWTKLVADADAVVLVTPEYNHTMSPVQLNAIDWIFKEWRDKPVALIGYGWSSGAALSHATAREVLGNLKARVIEEQANMFITKDIDTGGVPIAGGKANEKIAKVVTALLKT